MAYLTLRIELDNAAFRRDDDGGGELSFDEVASILKNAAEMVEDEYLGYRLYDGNGNCVGAYRIEEGSPTSIAWRVEEATPGHITVALFVGPAGYTRAKAGALVFRVAEWPHVREAFDAAGFERAAP